MLMDINKWIKITFIFLILYEATSLYFQVKNSVSEFKIFFYFY